MQLRLEIRYRDDGGIVILSPDMPDLFLAGDNHDAIWADLGPAIQLLLPQTLALMTKDAPDA